MLNDKSASVADLRELMKMFVSERKWERFHTPKNLAGSVSIEAAELMELFQWLTPEEALIKSQTDENFREKIGDEVSDVLLYLLSLANTIDIDISGSVEKKLAKNRIKYPVEACS